jgi:tRNA threonylcarbamoyladenosine biosynthesis protein TsaE
VRLRAPSADATRELAAAIGALLGAGDVLVLAGDLGAGKTTFTQGLAASLGVTAPVTSPTFTLVHEYRGRVPIVHIDVYRLENLQEVHDLGFDELVGGDAVAVVEWGDILGPLLPSDRLQLTFEYAVDDVNTRFVEATPYGATWAARAHALETALAGYEAD